MTEEGNRPITEISDLRHRVRRLNWFRQSFRREAEALGRRYSFRFAISERALGEAFFNWAKAFERERVASGRNRRDFAVFAGGLMLRELLRSQPAKSVEKGQFDRLVPPDPMAKICEFWPEGFLYTTYCLTLVRAVLEQDFDVRSSDNPQLHDIRTWESFRENFREDPALAVSFFDVFMGVEPNWAFPEWFLSRPGANADALTGEKRR
jgi:hypothetical protein